MEDISFWLSRGDFHRPCVRLTHLRGSTLCWQGFWKLRGMGEWVRKKREKAIKLKGYYSLAKVKRTQLAGRLFKALIPSQWGSGAGMLSLIQNINNILDASSIILETFLCVRGWQLNFSKYFNRAMSSCLNIQTHILAQPFLPMCLLSTSICPALCYTWQLQPTGEPLKMNGNHWRVEEMRN